MKYYILLTVLAIPSISLAQDFQTQFVLACEEGDTVKQLQVLEEWEAADADDPELYPARYNYHYVKAKKEVLAMSTEEPASDALVFQDSLGKTAGFITSGVVFDKEEIIRSLDCLDRGIAKFPTRLDMRFGKIYTLSEIEDWETFTLEVIATVDYSGKKSEPWLWTDNEACPRDNEFMLSAIQDYQLFLFDTQEDSLLTNMRQIAEAVLNHYPDHVESLSNLSSTYALQGDFQNALEPLLKAEAIRPSDYVVIANIANTYKELSNVE